LLFLNVSEERNENCTQKVAAIVRKMGIEEDIKFSRVHRMGQEKQGIKRPIIARFHFTPDRDRVWKARGQLKGTGTILKEDFPIQMEERRRAMLPICSHARLQGKEARLVRDSVIIDNRKYSVKDIEALPKELHPKSTCERKIEYENKTYILFSGKLSVFSNWYNANIEIDSQKYTSVEQFLVHQKAVFARDKESAEKALAQDDVWKLFLLGKRIQFSDSSWKKKSIDVMREGLRAKFKQNRGLEKCLVESA